MINIDEPLSEGSYEFSPTDRNQFSAGTQIAQTVPGASNFIGKLRNIVDGATNHSPIRWSSNGKQIEIEYQSDGSETAFTSLLKNYFGTERKDSFIRQLNNYGFTKCSSRSENGVDVFVHKHRETNENYFVRDNPGLLNNIKRSNKKKTNPAGGLKQQNAKLTEELQNEKLQNELLQKALAEANEKKRKYEIMHGRHITNTIHGNKAKRICPNRNGRNDPEADFSQLYTTTVIKGWMANKDPTVNSPTLISPDSTLDSLEETEKPDLLQNLPEELLKIIE